MNHDKPPETRPRGRSAAKPSARETERLTAALLEEEKRRAALLFMLEDLEENRRRIEQSRREWTKAFDAIRDPLFIHDEHYRIVRANRAYAERAGLGFAEIIGRPYWEVFPKGAGPLPRCRAAVESQLLTVVEEFTLATQEVFTSRAFVILDDQQRYLYSIHVLEDITETRRAEAERRLLSEALRQSAAGLVLLNADLSIRYANPAACRLVGYESGQLEGVPLATVVAADRRARIPAIRAAVDANGSWQGEVALAARDGAPVPAYLAASAIQEAGSPASAYVASWLDLRPIRQAQEQLAASEARFRRVTETVPDILYETTLPRHATSYISPALQTLTGFEPAEFTDAPDRWAQQLHVQDRERVFAELARAQESGAEGYTIEYRLWHRDGETLLWFEDRGAIEWGAPGEPPRVYGAMTDITARKLTQEALHHRLRSEALLAEISARFVKVEPAAIDLQIYDALRALGQFTGVERCYVLRSSADGAHLTAGHEWRAPGVAPASCAWTGQAATELPWLLSAMQRREVLYVPDVRELPSEAREEQGAWQGQDIRSLVCVPMVYEQRLAGVLGFENLRAARTWGADDLRLLQLAADLLANAMQNAERERTLHALNRALKTLSLGNEALVRAEDEAQLLREVCQLLVEQGGYRMAWVGYAVQGAPRLMAAAGCGAECREASDAVGMERARTPFGRALASAQPLLVGDALTDPDYAPWRQEAQERGYRAVLVLPLLSEGRVLGALSVYNAAAFDRAEMDLLANLAGDLAYGIASLRTRVERARLEAAQHRSAEQLQRSLLQTIQAIALTVEKRDPYTAGHQQAVARLSAAIAQELGLEPGRIEGIRLGAMIHDIGKVYVPAEILNRSGKLSSHEFEIIKSHPQVGYDIIQGVDFPWPVRDMVLQHHERLDGSGYPHGLQGGQIALEARILAVADVVEAISSHRPYRPARGLDKALAEIGEHRGTRYDPAVVDACLRLFRDKSFTLSA